mgnify:CR=1 FL=1
MRKFLLIQLLISILALSIPTIAFEDNENDFNIKYELNASLDELVLNYCNTFDSFTINKLYSAKDIIKNDKIRQDKHNKFFVVIKKKPLSPNVFTNIKTLNYDSKISILSENDLNYLSGNKKKFVRTVLPLIINENQKIISTRKDLILLKKKLNTNNTLSHFEIKNLKKISKKYKIKFDTHYKSELIEKLIDRIDVIPNSIVLAQAAIESGWGSSRFAKEYNALFGEYTYDNNKGVIPLKRKNGENHLIKSFKSYNSSVQSYFNNINSHYAYQEFREIRKIMRIRNNFGNINLLVEQLNTYAEDENYINTIRAVIEENNFTKFDLKTISY